MTANYTTRLAVAILLVALVGGAMAVGPLASSHIPEESTDQATTYLRVAHATADAPAVDVYLDNETVVSNASFGDVTDYLTLEAGTYNLTITAAGDPDTVVFEDNVTLSPRTATTVAASGAVSEDAEQEFAPRAFTDNPFTPGANDSALRVVHLSADAPAVNVTTANGSVVLAENVSFGESTDYLTVPAGEYAVEIRTVADDDNGTLVDTVNVSVEGGVAYTAWAIGNVDPAEDEEPFTVGLTEDATMTVHLPTEEVGDENVTETPEGTETPGEEGTATPSEEETPEGTETPADEETPTPTETATPSDEETPTPSPEATETPEDSEPTPPDIEPP